MSRVLTRCSLYVVAVLGVVVYAVPVATAAEDPAQLACRVVKTSGNIEPGEVVVVSGGKHTLDLMEAIAIEVQKAGGMPTMFLNTDRVLRARYAESPEEFLDQEPKYFAEWLEQIDLWIGLPGAEDPKAVFADIPEERFAKSARAGAVIRDMLNESGVRVVFIDYPTREQAANNSLDFATYEKMHWRAVKADYQKISEKGDYLRNILQSARTVRVTSPHGTAFTFDTGKRRPIIVDDGIVTAQEARSKTFLTRLASLPGGSLSFAPIERSANGKVVVPKHRCRFAPLTGISFEFKNGKLVNLTATEGADCFEETMAPYTGPKDMFASIQIGLNPELKVMENPGDFRPTDAAGMVTISIGYNELLGGKNTSPGGFSFPIVDATVLVDGREVITDGKLGF